MLVHTSACVEFVNVSPTVTQHAVPVGALLQTVLLFSNSCAGTDSCARPSRVSTH